MRDKIKTIDYFDRYIEEELDDIRFYEESLDSGKTKMERVDAVKKQIFLKKYSIVMAMYSKGDSVESVREEFLELLHGEIVISDLNNRYVQFLWLLSLGILLNVDDFLLDRLLLLVRRDGLNDKLINFLIKSRNPEWDVVANSYLHPIPYRTFDQILYVDKLSATEGLKQYLEKSWYKGHGGCGWHDGHKSKQNIYSGYWSFESAAIVKILNLDDSDFKDNKYYPHDLSCF